MQKKVLVQRPAYLAMAVMFALGPLSALATLVAPGRPAVVEEESSTATVIVKDEQDLIRSESSIVALPRQDVPVLEKHPLPTAEQDDPRLDLAQQARSLIESRERDLARTQEELFLGF